jgi:hypothetical protein
MSIDKALEEAVLKVNRYGRLTDVSNITAMLERVAKTADFEMKAFLLQRVFSMLNALESRFPLADAMEEPPEIRPMPGNISLGSIVDGAGGSIDFKLSKEDLNKNILIAAAVGHGKTSLIYNLLTQLKGEDLAYLVFDLKRDYKSLALEEDTIYLDAGSLRINPFEPPAGVPFKEWAVHLVDTFSHAFSLLIGSRDFLLRSMLDFYDSTDDKGAVTLPNFLCFLDEMHVRSEYFKVVQGRIAALLASSDIFSCGNGIDISGLDKFNVVIGMDKLGLPEQFFVFSLVLSHLFYMNINDPTKRGNLYKVIVVDDAHTLLDVNRERDYAMGIPVIHQIIAKMRELGVGFIFADQQMSSLISGVIQNSNTKFIGRINMMDDLNRVFGRALDTQVVKTVSTLNTGEFLVLSDKATPFCVMEARRIKMNKDIDDVLVQINQRGYKKFLYHSIESDDLSIIRQFMSEVSKNPESDSMAHKKNLSPAIDSRKFDIVRQKLLKDNLIDEISLRTSEGKTSKFIYLKASAAEKIEDISINEKPVLWERDVFAKMVLKRLIIQKLTAQHIEFTEDETGLLLGGFKKVYITFMDKGDALSKIMETAFYKVIDVVDDSITESTVLLRLRKISKPEALVNLKNLRVFEPADFNLF